MRTFFIIIRHTPSDPPNLPHFFDAYFVSYGYDGSGRMNAVVWNVNGVPGRTDYSYVPHSDLLAGMTTARTGGVYTAVTADYTWQPVEKRDLLRCASKPIPPRTKSTLAHWLFARLAAHRFSPGCIEPHRDVKTQVLNRAGVRVISQYDYRYKASGAHQGPADV